MPSLIRIFVDNGRTMSLTFISDIIIILLICFCVANTWAQVDIKFNNLNASDYGVTFHDNNDVNVTLSENNLRGSEKVRIQLYYECLCPYCKHFGIDELMPLIETMSADLNIQIYPFGKAEMIDNNGKYEFKCQHGPAECYGNELHACALDNLQHTTALLYNVCLMNSTNGKGSDDRSAERCGRIMNIDSEPIKECARSTKGSELLRYYGEESKKAKFSYVPYVLINGEVFDGDDFKTAVCKAFTNPPPACQ